MNKIGLINTLFAKYGGHVPIDTLNELSRERYLQQINFYTSCDPDINTGIINNQSFNAIASRNKYGEFIGLFAGAISQITLFAYQIFSNPKMFPTIGDNALEAKNEVAINALKSGNFGGLTIEEILPKDKERLNAAERIAECACLILYMHEAAHIRACHPDLIFESFGMNNYLEFYIQPANKEESLIMRSLELEADSVALMNGLMYWRGLVKHTGVHGIQSLNATQVWLTAAELLFWVMSCQHDDMKNYELSSHPRVTTRLINIRNMIGLGGETDEEIMEAFSKSDNSISKWFYDNKFSSEIIPVIENPEKNSSEVVNEMVELKNYIEKLWPILEQYSNKREKTKR